MIAKKLLSIFFVFFCILFFAQDYYFTDNKDVINKGQFKIEVRQENNLPRLSLVKFKLFRKKNKKWHLVQNHSFTKEKGFYLDVTLDEDLNNDGYNDMKISYAQAARGANEVCKLFIFNPKTNAFIDVVNSQEYPNLHYNKKLNNINSNIFYGGNGTVFLKLVKNRLKELAYVYYGNDSAYIYKVKDGKRILLKKQSYETEDAAVFFENYHPLE